MSDDMGPVQKLGVWIEESTEQRAIREGLQEAFADVLPDFQAAANRMFDQISQEAQEDR
jgi:hypothetical protein